MDLSLADTLYALMLGRRYKLASDLKRDLHVSDKQYVPPMPRINYSFNS